MKNFSWTFRKKKHEIPGHLVPPQTKFHHFFSNIKTSIFVLPVLLTYDTQFLYQDLSISLMSRVFANGPGGPRFNPRSSHTKDF